MHPCCIWPMRLQGMTNITPAVWQAALALFCWALLCALLCTGVAKVLFAVNGYHVVHLLPIVPLCLLPEHPVW